MKVGQSNSVDAKSGRFDTFKSIFQLAIEPFIEALIPSENIDALCSKVKNYLTYINFLEVIKI